MNVVEYLDDSGKPTGQYAKRYGTEVEVEKDFAVFEEIAIKDEVNGKERRVLARKVKKRKVTEIRYRDEPIPVKRYCICDAAGKIVSLHEMNFSTAVELQGAKSPCPVPDGCECHPVETWPAGHSKDDYDAIHQNFKMGKKDPNGRRILIKK